MNIERFKQLNLLSLANYLHLPLERRGKEWRVKGFQGLVIRDNMFYRFSTEEYGTAISFVMLTQQLSFKEAIKLLDAYAPVDSIENPPFLYAAANPKKKDPFILSTKEDSSAAISYLTIHRGLPLSIILEEIDEQRIAVSPTYDNILFICKDKALTPQGAIVHSSKPNSSFKGLLENSNTEYGYWISPIAATTTSSSLYIFEAPIDLLSFITLYGRKKNAYYIAMGGLKHSVLIHFLEMFREATITSLYCCTDNDKEGHNFFTRITSLFSSAYTLKRYTSNLKDWNEDLLSRK